MINFMNQRQEAFERNELNPDNLLKLVGDLSKSKSYFPKREQAVPKTTRVSQPNKKVLKPFRF